MVRGDVVKMKGLSCEAWSLNNAVEISGIFRLFELNLKVEVCFL